MTRGSLTVKQELRFSLHYSWLSRRNTWIRLQLPDKPESSINFETPECEKSAPESIKDSVCSDYSNPKQSQKPKLGEPNYSKGKSCDKPLTKNRTVPEELTQQQREQRQPTPVVLSTQHTKEMKKKCQPQFQAQQPPLHPLLPLTSQKSILLRQTLKKPPPLFNQQPQQP